MTRPSPPAWTGQVRTEEGNFDAEEIDGVVRFTGVLEIERALGRRSALFFASPCQRIYKTNCPDSSRPR